MIKKISLHWALQYATCFPWFFSSGPQITPWGCDLLSPPHLSKLIHRSHAERNEGLQGSHLLGGTREGPQDNNVKTLLFFYFWHKKSTKCMVEILRQSVLLFPLDIWISLYLTGKGMHLLVGKQSAPNIAIHYIRKRSPSHPGSPILPHWRQSPSSTLSPVFFKTCCSMPIAA